MGLPGRWFSERDMRFINSINSELMGDMIQTAVLIFKMAANQTQTNLYGENDPSTGKMFYPGVEITAIIANITITANNSINVNPLLFNFIYSHPLIFL
jgi:hypothetical protein